MSDAVRKTARQAKTEPLLEDYWLWVETLDPVPGSKLAEAVSNVQNLKPYLSTLLDDLSPPIQPVCIAHLLDFSHCLPDSPLSLTIYCAVFCILGVFSLVLPPFSSRYVIERLPSRADFAG